MAKAIVSKVTPEATPNKGLRDQLTALIQSLPAEHQAGFEKWRKDHAMELEIAEGAKPDSLCVCLAALEEITQISANLTGLVETFAEMGELAENFAEERFADILRPTQRWLATVVSSDLPMNLGAIREHIIDSGYGNEILGG